ncbi:hypothetical protein PHYC_00192 [Phycisphaerales bacterium]|nr:hypothetical protein PHYC_00192 [Phycisphaerales bacterium]
MRGILVRRRGAILLECLLALAIFVAAGLAILAYVDRASGSMTLTRDTLRAADLARTAMSRIEAGVASADTMSGPVRPEDEEESTLSAEAWELEVRSEPAGPQGLSRVTIRAIKRPSGGSDRELASFTLVQGVRLARRAER